MVSGECDVQLTIDNLQLQICGTLFFNWQLKIVNCTLN
jgi:hypothetical protein